MSLSEKTMLWAILGVALLFGVGYWAYYGFESAQEAPPLSSSPPPAPPANYRSDLKVTFTNDVYPPDSHQSNPRIRRYVGKIQNQSDQIFVYVQIRVAYLDKNEKPIFEQIIPVNTTLKPNFIQEFQFGGLQVPADWSGKVDYEITEYRFADTEKVEVLPRTRIDSRLERPPLQQILFPF